MLVLTRKENETVKVGENIKITVVRIDRGAVRIGIEAPESVNISREGQSKQRCKRNNYLIL